MIETTNSGMICSVERTSEEMARPRIAEATQVAATVMNSSAVAASVEDQSTRRGWARPCRPPRSRW